MTTLEHIENLQSLDEATEFLAGRGMGYRMAQKIVRVIAADVGSEKSSSGSGMLVSLANLRHCIRG